MLSVIASKNLFQVYNSFVMWVRARSSVSVLDVVTVFCFVDLQSIAPPKVEEDTFLCSSG